MPIIFKKPNRYPVYLCRGRKMPVELFGVFFENAKKMLVVTDETVFKLYKNKFDGVFPDKELFYCVLPSGEAAKSFDAYRTVIESATNCGLHREDGFIAFGGGTITDVTGFAAATYMRGVKFASVPTTVLAAIDAAVGAKNGVNFIGVKNYVGTVYAPQFVYVERDFFKTLSKRDMISGYGEIIKCAFLGADITEDELKSKLPSLKLIEKCLRIKENIADGDVYESGKRKLLNLGHTFGHAIESLSGFSIPHGECVVKGINFALRISVALNGLSEEKFGRAMRILTAAGHDVTCSYPLGKLKEFLIYDKKGNGETIDFVAFDKDLTPIIVPITISKLIGALE